MGTIVCDVLVIGGTWGDMGQALFNCGGTWRHGTGTLQLIASIDVGHGTGTLQLTIHQPAN